MHEQQDKGVSDTDIPLVEEMDIQERRLVYQECARHLLTRYLLAKELVKEPLDTEECHPSVEECTAENADGILYLFYVRGSVWGVMLSRQEESRKIIEESPERLADPELFIMDFRKAARIQLRNEDFRKYF